MDVPTKVFQDRRVRKHQNISFILQPVVDDRGEEFLRGGLLNHFLELENICAADRKSATLIMITPYVLEIDAGRRGGMKISLVLRRKEIVLVGLASKNQAN